MTQEELKEALRLHALWLEDPNQGKRANLRNADLRCANLRNVDLRGADLRNADLRCADLRGADLRNAVLRNATLRNADLRFADLRGADLRDANLQEADLRNATLRDANLQGADLSYANLRDADLRGAVLRYIHLRATIGNMREVKSLQFEDHPITYTASDLQIGCERHPIKRWWAMDDSTIDDMDYGALDWWRKWKEPLRQMIELSPATPTEGENR